ncbi:MAG: sulfate adenylyltransferase subunit CysD [Lentisphaeria bacterium]|jgi:sulfate adenylyltransferase subunit 2|nr:sulfate adenylyltransferase subunit CysD [Lentisphaeria bacterium]
MERYRISTLDRLEAEAIHIMREVVAEFQNPVMLYSVGKDSSVMVRLAQKAFHPGRIPFPLLHVDTGMKFPEMYEFRDAFCREIGAELIVHRNEGAIAGGTSPWRDGTVKCCAALKTRGLLDALAGGGYDAAFGGARRDEEKSRAKERIFSFRDRHGQWDPKNQRPELWNIYNARINPGESIRVFPMSNWTELDIWHYIHRESIPIVPMYFAEERTVAVKGEQLIPVYGGRVPEGARLEKLWCRFRTLGCHPCTGAIASRARTVPEIIEEMMVVTKSERTTRVIDHDQDGSMELKKREGYF